MTWLSYFGSENQGLPLRLWFVTCWLWFHIPIVTSLAVPSSCVVTQTPMGTNSGTRSRKRKFPLLFTRGQFWPPGIVVACVCVCVCVCVYQSLACPDDNSSPVQARITKFGPEKQNTLVKFPIVLGGNWPWPSRSNLTPNSKLTPFWACPNHNSPPILVRISKFGQQMHFSTVKMPVNSGLDWPWTSPSFLIRKLFFFHCGGVHWDCETVPGMIQCCSGTVSQSLHQCTWGTLSQSGMGPMVL